MKLKDRVAVVTAAAGAGIGQAVARKFAEEGAEVMISDAHGRRVQEVAARMSKDYGREVSAFTVDVTQKDQVEAMVRGAVERFGRIDILFNNAGINKLEPVWEMSDETWSLVLNVCLTGTFYVTRAVLPHMIRQRSGAIVSMASVAGWIASDAGQAHYCAAKAGVMAFTRSVAAECGKHGIRANAIAPGIIYNEFLNRIYPPGYFEARKEHALLGRLGEPAEVANLALFLASADSAYITGEVFCVSGGSYVRG
ncbi:MAG: SDR family oxidoreductase [Candidatus Rokubacteria bacterium]|nr:SDR family oxidoreductase [Candidatus Rokubacteria bacterium]